MIIIIVIFLRKKCYTLLWWKIFLDVACSAFKMFIRKMYSLHTFLKTLELNVSDEMSYHLVEFNELADGNSTAPTTRLSIEKPNATWLKLFHFYIYVMLKHNLYP